MARPVELFDNVREPSSLLYGGLSAQPLYRDGLGSGVVAAGQLDKDVEIADGLPALAGLAKVLDNGPPPPSQFAALVPIGAGIYRLGRRLVFAN